MSKQHPVVAVTGSSGAGTTTVKTAFEHIFRRLDVTASIIEGDSFHKYNREEMRAAEGRVFDQFDRATVRLHGTLRARWRLDELDLAVDARTRIDKSPRPGDYVEVRGRLDETGKVQVGRLRRR